MKIHINQILYGMRNSSSTQQDIEAVAQLRQSAGHAENVVADLVASIKLVQAMKMTPVEKQMYIGVWLAMAEAAAGHLNSEVPS